MTITIGRRTSSFALAAVLVAAGLSSAAPAQADTPFVSYSCKLPILGSKPFPIAQGTNAPATLKVGKSVTPTMTTKAQVPTAMANLMSKELGARKVEGTIVATVKTNGTARAIVQKISAKAVPATNTSPLLLVATGKLPKVTAKKAGTLTFLPGNLKITLKFSKASGASAGTFANMGCTMPRTTAVIDRIQLKK